MEMRAFFLGSMMVTLLTGCVGGRRGDGAEAGAGGGVEVDDLPAEMAQAVCAAAEDCLGSSLERFVRGHDCVTLMRNRLEDSSFPNLRDAIEDGRVAYDGESMRSCLDAMAASGCDALGTGRPDACERALEGTVEDGSPCGVDEECVGDAFCDRSGAVCPGTCAARREEGSVCREDRHCQAGLVCFDVGECVRPGGAGEPCSPRCAPGLECVGPDRESGTCRTVSEVATAREGEACDPLLETGTLCEEGLSCVLVSLAGDGGWECRPRVGSGAPCQWASPSQCPSGEYCAGTNLSADVLDGTCAPLPREGEACADDGAPSCAPGHACVTGSVCRLVQRNGGGCMVDDECYSGSCQSGACAPDAACRP